MHAYWNGKLPLKLMHSYFTYGNQDAEINDTNSSWSETLFAVQKGSNIDRLLRYTFI